MEIVAWRKKKTECHIFSQWNVFLQFRIIFGFVSYLKILYVAFTHLLCRFWELNIERDDIVCPPKPWGVIKIFMDTVLNQTLYCEKGLEFNLVLLFVVYVHFICIFFILFFRQRPITRVLNLIQQKNKNRFDFMFSVRFICFDND